MLRAMRSLLLCAAFLSCAAFGGCSAISGGMPSLTSVGGDSSEVSARAALTPQPVASQSSSGGGIWSNFSSAFNSGAAPTAASAPAPQIYHAEAMPSLDASEALRLVNDYRNTKGLPPLTLESRATAAAEILVKDLAVHDHMSHLGPGKADLQKRLSMAGYRYKVAAENVCVGQRSFAEIVEAWKQSPPHSRNMLLADAKHLGVAFEYKPDTKYKTYWTLVVAAP